MYSKYNYPLKGKRIFVAGHSGFLGSAICRRLQNEDVDVLSICHDELDLTRQLDVERWMDRNRPDVVVIAAAKVGGILANDIYPAEFIYRNIAIETNLIHSAHLVGVEKLVMLGSSCSYPKMATQPIHESALMDGKPEATNQWYTVAKIAGIKLCEAYRKQYGYDFISILPANLFGPGDNFHPQNSHVIPGLIRRFHEAKIGMRPREIIWGSGKPKREFMYVDDASDAIVFLIQNYSGDDIVNVGTGQEISIVDLSHEVARSVGYNGEFVFDVSKPDGAPRKVLDVSKLHSLGWHHKASFSKELDLTYRWFEKNII